MPKRSSTTRKRPRQDENQAAFDAIRQLTGDDETGDKNPAAVYLGRRGGLKGGPARAKKLSARRRKAIARKAAKARWDNGT